MKYILFIFIIGLLFVKSQDFPVINPNYVSYMSYNNYIDGFTFSSKEYNFFNVNQNITVREFEDVTIYSDWNSNTTSINFNSTWYNFQTTSEMESSFKFLKPEGYLFVKNETIDRGFNCSVFENSIDDTIMVTVKTIESFDLTDKIDVSKIKSMGGDSCFSQVVDNVASATFSCEYKDEKTTCTVLYTQSNEDSSSSEKASSSDEDSSSSEKAPSSEASSSSSSEKAPSSEASSSSSSEKAPSSEASSSSEKAPSSEASSSSNQEPSTLNEEGTNLLKLFSGFKQGNSFTTQCTFDGLLEEDIIKTFGSYENIESKSINITAEINAKITTYISLPNNIPVRIIFQGNTQFEGKSKPVDINIGFVDWTFLEALPSSFIKPNCTDNKCPDLPVTNESFGTPQTKKLENATTLSLNNSKFSAVFEDVVDFSLVSVNNWYHDQTLQMDAFIIEQSKGEIYSRISNDGANSFSVDTFTLSCNNNVIKTSDFLDETLIQILTKASQFEWTLGERTIRRSVDVDQWTTTIDGGKSITLFTFARGWQFLFRHGLNSSSMSIPVAIEITTTITVEGSTTTSKKELDIFLFDIIPVPTKIKNFNEESCIPTLPSQYNTMITMSNLKYGYTQQYQEIFSLVDTTTTTIGRYHSSDLYSIYNKNHSVTQWGSDHKCKTFEKLSGEDQLHYSSTLANQLADISTLSKTYSKLTNTTHQWTSTDSNQVIVHTWSVNSESVSPIRITISFINPQELTTTLIQTIDFYSYSTSTITNVNVPTNCTSIVKEESDDDDDDDDDDKDDEKDNLEQKVNDHDDDEDDEPYGPKSFDKEFTLPTIDTKKYPKVSNTFTINIQVTTTDKDGVVSKSNSVVWKYSKDKLAESYTYTNKLDGVELCFTDSSMNIANISLNGSKSDGPYSNSYYNKYFFGDISIARLFTDQSYLNQFTISTTYTTVDGLKLTTLSKEVDNSTVYYFPAGWTFETFDTTSTDLSAPLLITKANNGSTETWRIIKYDNTVDSDLYSKCQPPKKGGLHINISKNGIIAVVIVVIVVLAGVGAIVFIVIKKRGGLGKKMPAHILLDEKEQNRTYES
ncbi:hypothetical protein ACTFIU_007459 [Dictyostelium citrinum]